MGDATTALLADRLDGLTRELADAAAAGVADPRAAAGIAVEVDALRRDADRGPAYAVLAGYDRLCDAKAALLNRAAEVAAAYDSMESFWADADAQERGESRRTYWDTYEHGRRRQLEKVLAGAYGAADAVLLNTGMSAVDVALRAAGLGPGSRLLTGERSYFETGEYLDGVLAAAGVEVVRAPLADEQAVADAVARHQPRALLVETALNSPPCGIAPPLHAAVAAGVTVVADNSTLSHGVRWFDLLPDGDVLVVESGIKYLTSRCTAGVVYGRGPSAGAARRVARQVGQQLQERAFNHLQVAELAGARRKVALHGSNLRDFVTALDPAPWAWSVDAERAAGGRADAVAAAVRAGGPGALLFLRLRGPDGDVAARHRAVLRRWRERCVRQGVDLRLRAGFGWDVTSARSYESSRLNQADAPVYLRVSVGIEPADEIATIAGALNDAVNDAVNEAGATGREG